MTKASCLLKWKKLNKAKKEFQPLASGFLTAGVTIPSPSWMAKSSAQMVEKTKGI